MSGGVIFRQDLREMIVTFRLTEHIFRFEQRDAPCEMKKKTGTGYFDRKTTVCEMVGRRCSDFIVRSAVAAGEQVGSVSSGLGLGYRYKYIWTMVEKCSGPDRQQWVR